MTMNYCILHLGYTIECHSLQAIVNDLFQVTDEQEPGTSGSVVTQAPGYALIQTSGSVSRSSLEISRGSSVWVCVVLSV